MPPNPRPTVNLRRLALRLRKLREATGLSQQAAAQRAGLDPVTVHRYETGKTRPQPGRLKVLMNVYEVDEATRQRLEQLLKESGRRGLLETRADLPEEYGTLIEFEEFASDLRVYEGLFIPGLLQTEGYARAVIQGGMLPLTAEEIDSRVETRMARRDVLTRPDPLHLWAVIDEAALRRVVGSAEVMRAQLQHLVETATLPHVTLQVIPFDAGAHPAMLGGFTILEFPEDPAVAYADTIVAQVFLDEDDEVRRYSGLYQTVVAAALHPARSVELIADMAESLS